jgi:hypothetical protein
VQIGSDVECFLRDSSNQIVNAAKHIKQSKHDPYKKQKIKIYYDNILAEFNIPPCDNGKDFVANITNGLYLLEKLAAPCKLNFTAASIIDLSITKDENAIENGCNDETNAYTLEFNKDIENFIKNSRFRTCGGHIHIGMDASDKNLQDPVIKPLFVYMLDLFLGIPSVVLDKDMTQANRRQAFGKAGAYRSKIYGIEYRVLSSWWVTKPEYVALIYNIVEFVYYAMQDKIWEKFWSINEEDEKISYNCFGYDDMVIRNTINNCDRAKASKLLNFIYNFMPNELVKQIVDIINI